ncbi:xylose isomerase-like protein [Aspergillus californicus]
MTSTTTEPPKIPLSYATCSLGTPNTPLPTKLQHISNAGFTGIELAFPDLLNYASTLYNHSVAPDSYPELRTAASQINQLCKTLNLTIIMLQPFSNFEGWPRGSKEREDAFSRARGWIGIMEAAGIGILQVGSSDTPLERLAPRSELGGCIVADLGELCDMLAGAKGGNKRVAYENWCWSSHASTWSAVWEIVQAVNRDNIGLCLDTFQSAGGEYGDPTTSSGLLRNIAPNSPEERKLYEEFEKSMALLSSTVPKEKIYLLQVSDAYRLSGPGSSGSVGPLEDRVVDGTAPRGRWSHDFRPMPYDGGYLPIEAFGRAVLKTGFRGWFSMEIFDEGVDGKGRDVDLGEFAGRAGSSMQSFIGNCLE